jgi:hypothetical protein
MFTLRHAVIRDWQAPFYLRNDDISTPFIYQEYPSISDIYYMRSNCYYNTTNRPVNNLWRKVPNKYYEK